MKSAFYYLLLMVGYDYKNYYYHWVRKISRKTTNLNYKSLFFVLIQASVVVDKDYVDYDILYMLGKVE
jgi:hypothetical protein